MNFYSLHNHTYSSNIRFLDCINRPEDLVDKAIKLGFQGLAFTDHESLSAAISILKIKDKIKESNPDFKIIFGNEIYLIDETERKNTNKYYHFILLAKDRIGWDQLRELSSYAWENSYFEKGQTRVPTTYQKLEEVIGKNPGHIMASSACIGGRLPCLILEHNVTEANNFVRWCMNIFGENNFALELQPSDSEEQAAVNKILVKMAKHYKIPFIVTTDSHYLNKEDFKIHSAFLNSKQSSDRETDKFYKYTYMMSEEEMISILVNNGNGILEEDAKQAIENTHILGEQVENYDFRHGTIVPKIKIPAFKLTRELYGNPTYPLINKFYDSSDEQDRYLMYQIEQGIHQKKIMMDDIKLERINKELDILDFISERLDQKLSSYLNLTVNIINMAWQVSLTAPGRGSSTGFYINYLIGITQIDPFVYGLKEWRFLNKERVELPDIDSDFQPEKTPDIIKILRGEYGEDHVLNCATFKTESLKSAILSCGRGMGFNNDDMQALAALVPAHRGITYSLKDCLEGDEEKGLEPVQGFREKVDKYPGLFEAIKKIEGLPTNASIHASALYIFNDGYLPQNSLMRAPNGTPITAFSMHDSDDMGALKMDVLRTDAQSKIAKCMDLLLKDNQIEWQGSLRRTYNKYLHPDNLIYDDPNMWKKMCDGSIQNLFQMDSPVGAIAMKKAQPKNVHELAEVNSIMRLQSDTGEQPIDRYTRFTKDINEWYKEMSDAGLNKHEMEIMEKYLSKSHGVSGSQEVLMQILMDPEICAFTLGESNGARKAIAKKQAEKIIKLKKDFYEKGRNIKTREEFLNYTWKYCLEPQMGYSFSINHTVPYSVVAVQEANLATRWNPLYWACACLCVNAGNYVGDLAEDYDEELEEVEVVEEDNEEEDEKKTKRVAPNYGKIAKAIADAQKAGVQVDLPDINEAQQDFIPDISRNAIIYSLQAINVVNDELLNKIIENRPYKNIYDFYDKVQPSASQMYGLIKAGCFDNLEKEPRTIIVNKYLNNLAEKEYPLRDKLTMVQLKKALDLGMDLSDYHDEVRLYKFKKYIDKNQINKSLKRYELTQEQCIKFFKVKLEKSFNITKGEYGYIPDGIQIKVSAFERIYKTLMDRLISYLNTLEGRQTFAEFERNNYIQEIKDKYFPGSVAAWEMSTMCFYHEKHELAGVNHQLYNARNFDELPENADTFGKSSPDAAKICSVIGTVINADNNRHIVSLLTVYGVVDVKFYSKMYTTFNQQYSKIDSETKKKTVTDPSWFKRGTKILVYGYRRENSFVAKSDYSSGYARSVCLIEGVLPDGSLQLRYKRNKA